MYDSYAKTVMRNKCRNALRAKRRRQRYEIVGAEKIQYLFEMQSHTDVYTHCPVIQGWSVCLFSMVRLPVTAKVP